MLPAGRNHGCEMQKRLSKKSHVNKILIIFHERTKKGADVLTKIQLMEKLFE
jgi:hypothetical protein